MKRSVVGVVILLNLVFVLLFTRHGVEVAAYLLIGWYEHAQRVLPAYRPDTVETVLAICCFWGLAFGGRALWNFVANHRGGRAVSGASALGLVGMLVVLTAAGIAAGAIVHQSGWIMRRGLQEGGNRYHKVVCYARLREISIASRVYAGDNDRWLPDGEGIAKLVDLGYLDSRNRRCPMGSEDAGDYHYLGSGLRLSADYLNYPYDPDDPQDRSKLIIAHDRLADHRYHRFINCAFADGRADGFKVQDGETFIEAVERQGYRLARELTAEERN